MLTSILTTLLPFATGFGGAAVTWYMRGAMGKIRDPKPSPKPVADKSVADMIKQGYEAVDRMARDIHSLYHPDGCKCVYCELRADDNPPERVAGELCKSPCFGCSVLTCDKHPDHASEPNFVVVVEGKPVPARVSVEETIPDNTAYSPEYIRALKEKIHGLRKENTELRKGKGEKVVSKVVERESVLDKQIKQCAKFADEGQEPIKLDLEIQGRPIQVVVGPQREPDEKVVSFGGEVVRPIWYDKPQSGPGSLGIMDRQLGTIGHRCDYCRKNAAWKYSGSRLLCKECYHEERVSPTSEITEIRQEGGRKYVCYRDGHCEVT